MRIAGIQMTSTANIDENIAYIERVLKNEIKEADLVVLPENALLFNGKQFRSIAESEYEIALLERLSNLAKKYGVYLLLGSHPTLSQPDGNVVSNGRVRQSSIMFDDQGEQIARYDKIHLFDAAVSDKTGQYKESDYIEPGDINPIVVDVKGVKVGLVICYDLRFPELFRVLADKGAQMIIVPAAFTYQTGAAHWQALLRARAIENQCYVFGVNQCGWHNETRQTYGHSQLVDPWGDVVSELGEEVGVVAGLVDIKLIDPIRVRMPCLEHRRIRS